MSDDLQPIINDLNAPFWAGAREGKLVLPYCVATQRPFWPPSPMSPWAEHAAIGWREAPARGVVRAMGVYRRVFLKAFEPLAPYAIALVELAENVRLHAHVADAHGANAPKVGDAVRLHFRVLIESGQPVLCAERVRG
ncbi:MAG: OB-fold domain-containing protein [Caulobacterales bacterium]|jgi:uncharacterized OB-fold protein|nr:OB-fold domain-containing protein [Caulobacterales bacterium]